MPRSSSRPGPKGKGSDALRRAAARMAGLTPENSSSSISLSHQQQDLIEHWREHPWNFLAGHDADKDKTPIIWTKDERDRLRPVKPFPKHLEYLKIFISILFDPDEKFILADKSRQMYLSTACLLYMLWESIFLPGRRWLLSKSTEDESKEMIKDKIRFPSTMLPEWFQNWAQIQKEPEIRVDIDVSGSYILGVAQNVAEREARGGTASGILIDEAAFQDKFEDMVAAALPMAAKIVAITTPNARALKFKEYMDDKVIADYMTGHRYVSMGKVMDLVDEARAKVIKKSYPKIPGMSVQKTAKGVTVIHLDYWADPTKDAKWAQSIRDIMPTETRWRIEYMRDWETVPGEAFYAEFQENQSRYVHTLPRLINAPVYRGWDFGRRTPACVWLQYSPVTGRVWVVREILPVGLDIYSFRNLVMYLSGERERGFLDRNPSALKWLEALEADPHTPESLRVTPWFHHTPTAPISFIDYAGHEANQAGDANTSTVHVTRAQILGAEGISLQVHYTTTKAKTDQFRRLLQNLPDGRPGLYFDPSCKLLIKGFAGGITYAKPSATNLYPTEPFKDGIYDNLHEALGYVVVNAVPMVEQQEEPGAVLMGYDGQRQPIMEIPGQDIDFGME
jgi:hypothetical protein